IVCALYSLRSRLFFSCAGEHRDLHSFPTRRSSDLLCSIHRWRWVELEATSFLVDRVGATMRAMPCTLLACRVNIGSPACPIPIPSRWPAGLERTPTSRIGMYVSLVWSCELLALPTSVRAAGEVTSVRSFPVRLGPAPLAGSAAAARRAAVRGRVGPSER